MGKTKRKNYLIITAVLVLLIVGGIWAYYFLYNSQGNANDLGEISSVDFLLEGVVEEMGKDTLIISTPNPPSSEVTNWVKERVVSISKNTEIVVLTEKDPEQFSKEFQEFEKELQRILEENPEQTENLPQPPASFIENRGYISDIKISSRVLIS